MDYLKLIWAPFEGMLNSIPWFTIGKIAIVVLVLILISLVAWRWLMSYAPHPEKMSIFWGKKGAGKSSKAVSEILTWYEAGLDIVTNIHINARLLPKTKTPGRIFHTEDPNDLQYFRGKKNAPILFVFDEAYLKFNSRKWGELSDTTHQLMAQARKIHVEIIIIAQGFKRIDLVLREICDVFVRFKSAAFGFGYTEYAEELSLTQENTLVPYGTADETATHGRFHFHRKRNWQAYDTDQLFGSLLKELVPKKFRDIVSDQELTFPAFQENGREDSTTPGATVGAQAERIAPNPTDAPQLDPDPQATA